MDHSPLSSTVSLSWFQLCGSKATGPLTHGQKVNGSLTLHPSAYIVLTSTNSTGTLSHIITRVSTGPYFEKEHNDITFITQ